VEVEVEVDVEVDEFDTPVGDFPLLDDDPPGDDAPDGPLPHPQARAAAGETSIPISTARMTPVRKISRTTLVLDMDQTPQLLSLMKRHVHW